MKHKHWDIEECKCEQSIREMHMNYIQLIGEVQEMLHSLEARDLLDKGVRGMGHNILVEKAAKFRGCIRTLQRLTDGGLDV